MPSLTASKTAWLICFSDTRDGMGIKCRTVKLDSSKLKMLSFPRAKSVGMKLTRDSTFDSWGTALLLLTAPPQRRQSRLTRDFESYTVLRYRAYQGSVWKVFIIIVRSRSICQLKSSQPHTRCPRVYSPPGNDSSTSRSERRRCIFGSHKPLGSTRPGSCQLQKN